MVGKFPNSIVHKVDRRHQSLLSISKISFGQNASQWILVLMLLLGLYLPTSSDGVISDTLKIFYLFQLMVFLIILILANGICSFKSIIFSLLIVITITVATIISPLKLFAFGAAPSFINLALLFLINLRHIRLPFRFQYRLLLFVNLINVILGISVVWGVSSAKQLLVANYSDFYQQLLEIMVLWYSKPVLTFGSHSIAAYFMFLFMYLNITTYKRTGERLSLLFGLVYLILIWFLQSVTAVFMFILAIAYCLYIFLPRTKKKIRHTIVWIPLIAIFLFIILILNFERITVIATAASLQIQRILTTQESGFLGRFSTSGTLNQNIAFILNSWYQPTGLRFSNELVFGDSGPIEYMIRGSFGLLISIYSGLFIFLYKNLRSQKSAIFIFLLILFAEVGFTYLKYFRFQYFLPFVIVYLNSLPEKISNRQNT